MNDINEYIKLIEHYERKPLDEGVKFGKKEQNRLLANASDYMVGIEYEFHPYDSLWYTEATRDHSIIGSAINKDDDLQSFELIPANSDNVEVSHYTWKIVYNDEEYFVNLSTNKILHDSNANLVIVDQLNDYLVAKIYDLTLLEDDLSSVPLSYFVMLRNTIYAIKDSPAADIDTVYESNIAQDIMSLTTEKGQEFVNKIFKNDNAGKLIADMIINMNNYDNDSSYEDALDASVKNIKENIDVFKNMTPTIDVMYEHHPDLEYYILKEEHDHKPIFDAVKELQQPVTVTVDNAYQVELITEPLPLDKAIESIREMSQFIERYGYTTEKSGMHISISVPKNLSTDIDFEKLFVLMNFEYINTELFAPRQYVESINDAVKQRVNGFIQSGFIDQIEKIYAKQVSAKNIYDNLFDYVGFEKLLNESKYFGMIFKYYQTQKGRIEMRYFGGENYEKTQNKIINEMLRVVYLVDIAYGDLYQKEYAKSRYKYIDKMFQEVSGTSLPEFIKNKRRR